MANKLDESNANTVDIISILNTDESNANIQDIISMSKTGGPFSLNVSWV